MSSLYLPESAVFGLSWMPFISSQAPGRATGERVFMKSGTMPRVAWMSLRVASYSGLGCAAGFLAASAARAGRARNAAASDAAMRVFIFGFPPSGGCDGLRYSADYAGG